MHRRSGPHMEKPLFVVMQNSRSIGSELPLPTFARELRQIQSIKSNVGFADLSIIETSATNIFFRCPNYLIGCQSVGKVRGMAF